MKRIFALLVGLVAMCAAFATTPVFATKSPVLGDVAHLPALGSMRQENAHHSGQPWSWSYNWSFSGAQYGMTNVPFKSLGHGFSTDMAAGFEVKQGQWVPAFGPGVGYHFEQDGFSFGAGAHLIFRQQQPPDVTIGVIVGYKF